MNRAALHGGVWFAGFVAGVAATYLGGPAVGYRLRMTGERLAAMDGATQLHTAAEVEAVVDQIATERVTALIGRVRR